MSKHCAYCGRFSNDGKPCIGCGASDHAPYRNTTLGPRNPWFLNGLVCWTERVGVLDQCVRIHCYRGSQYVCTLQFTEEIIRKNVPEGTDGVDFVWATMTHKMGKLPKEKMVLIHAN